MKRTLQIVAMILIATMLLSQTHTSAVIDVAQTWTAVQTFSSGINIAGATASGLSRQVTVTDLAPVVGDSGLIAVINPVTAIHLTRIWCAVQGSTNVVVNLDERTESTIGTDTGNHLLGSDLT